MYRYQTGRDAGRQPDRQGGLIKGTSEPSLTVGLMAPKPAHRKLIMTSTVCFSLSGFISVSTLAREPVRCV